MTAKALINHSAYFCELYLLLLKGTMQTLDVILEILPLFLVRDIIGDVRGFVHKDFLLIFPVENF
jgi:hypothetical protein